jgi:hypothetical protein
MSDWLDTFFILRIDKHKFKENKVLLFSRLGLKHPAANKAPNFGLRMLSCMTKSSIKPIGGLDIIGKANVIRPSGPTECRHQLEPPTFTSRV